MFRRLSPLFVALAFLLLAVPAAAAQSSPLLGNEFNCSDDQAAFPGGQPAPVGATVAVELSTSCYLVLLTTVEGGQVVNITYVSGPFDTLNVAFYLAGAGPGESFNNPPNAELGTPWGGRAVPGSGLQTVYIVLQGAGGPATGSASVRVGTRAPNATTTTAPATTVAPTTAAPTTATPTTVAPSTTATDTGDASDTASSTTVATETTIAPTSTVVAISPDDGSDAGDDQVDATDDAAQDESSATDTTVVGAADGGSGTDGSDTSGFSAWWWLIPVAGLAAAGAVYAVKGSLIGGVAAPWERTVITWTLQHAAPTGTCSSNARVIVDPNDDGSLAPYSISELFTLPTIKRRMRSTAGDQLLTQFDTLWANGGSGPELRSAVDVFANSLCRHLDSKKVPGDATLLAELTKSDVRLGGGLHACADGNWQPFATVGDVPDLPAGELQHDLVQVVVLASDGQEETPWADRSEELTEAITGLIETRRAPAGLWVFD
ncbi:MAG: hypothetical protein HKN94_07500 [Acidimicrobiales bacterium]|nr:hypothetical protein [Acidimicrobiales bacterium]